MKVCTGCGNELALTEFVRDARRTDGHRSICRSCMSACVSAGKRSERQRRFDPRPWHQGCRQCCEWVRNFYPGEKCRHAGAVQGVVELVGTQGGTFYPD